MVEYKVQLAVQTAKLRQSHIHNKWQRCTWNKQVHHQTVTFKVCVCVCVFVCACACVCVLVCLCVWACACVRAHVRALSACVRVCLSVCSQYSLTRAITIYSIHVNLRCLMLFWLKHFYRPTWSSANVHRERRWHCLAWTKDVSTSRRRHGYRYLSSIFQIFPFRPRSFLFGSKRQYAL